MTIYIHCWFSWIFIECLYFLQTSWRGSHLYYMTIEDYIQKTVDLKISIPFGIMMGGKWWTSVHFMNSFCNSFLCNKVRKVHKTSTTIRFVHPQGTLWTNRTAASFVSAKMEYNYDPHTHSHFLPRCCKLCFVASVIDVVTVYETLLLWCMVKWKYHCRWASCHFGMNLPLWNALYVSWMK